MKNLMFKSSFACAQDDGSKPAFSLVELLISLIIISILIAAFVPLITKKLKASDITVGSFGNSNSGVTSITRSPTKQDCDAIDAVFIPAAMNDGIKSICVTKYNVGDIDRDNDFAPSVKILNVGETCPSEDSGKCCWQGTTSSNCDNSISYSSCNRTVCQWQAANTNCAFYSVGNTVAGQWRLPTNNEMENWSTNIDILSLNSKEDGLQLCDSGESNAPKCVNIESCPGQNDNRCRPNTLWSSNGFYLLSNGIFRTDVDSNKNWAFSTRCVLDSIVEEIKVTDNSSSNEKPDKDYVAANEPTKEFCEKFDTFFLDKKVSGLNRNQCITKWNVGDGGGVSAPPIAIESGVISLKAGTGVCASNEACCWQGATGRARQIYCADGQLCGESKNGDSTYGGCNRTVCNWEGGNRSCLNRAPKGMKKGYRRLPTQDETDVWIRLMKSEEVTPIISRGMGSKGLQLCSWYDETGIGYTNCNHYEQACKGSVGTHTGAPSGDNNNACYPMYVWNSNKNNLALFGNRSSSAVIYSHANITATASSIRCVYDGLPATEEGIAESKQAICDKYNAMYVPAKYNGSGGVDLCVTKYNVGDNQGPTFANRSNLGINMLNVGDTCTTGKCCRQGTTATDCNNSGNGDSDYDGCTRTVCTRTAGNEACNSRAPTGSNKGDWRIPSYSEIQGRVSTTNSETASKPIISRWLGAKGLQFCDSTDDLHGGVHCSGNQRCITSSYTQCTPYAVWSADVHGYSLKSGTARYNESWNKLEITSARCVSSKVLK